MNDFEKLFSNLKAGTVYGYNLGNDPGPVFWSVLWYNPVNHLIYWKNYGQSANKATRENLCWILDTIFQTTATDFLSKYKVYGKDI